MQTIKLIVQAGEYILNIGEAKKRGRFKKDEEGPFLLDEQGNRIPDAQYGFMPLYILGVDSGTGMSAVVSHDVSELFGTSWEPPLVEKAVSDRQGIWSTEELSKVSKLRLSLEASRKVYSTSFTKFEKLEEGCLYLLELSLIRHNREQKGTPSIGVFEKDYHRVIKRGEGEELTALLVIKTFLSDSVVEELTPLTLESAQGLIEEGDQEELLVVDAAELIIKESNNASEEFFQEQIQKLADRFDGNGIADAGSQFARPRKPASAPILKPKVKQPEPAGEVPDWSACELPGNSAAEAGSLFCVLPQEELLS